MTEVIQDGFTDLNDGCPGQSKIVATNANTFAVIDLIKRNTRLTVKILLIVLAYFGFSSLDFYSAVKTCTQSAPIACLKNKKATSIKIPIFFIKKCQNCNKTRISELFTVDGINLSLRDASIKSSGCA